MLADFITESVCIAYQMLHTLNRSDPWIEYVKGNDYIRILLAVVLWHSTSRKNTKSSTPLP